MITLPKPLARLVLTAAAMQALTPALGVEMPPFEYQRPGGFKVSELPFYCHQWYASPEAARWVEPTLAGIEKIDFSRYDWIVVNTSGGKDSQEALRVTYNAAKDAGFPLDHIIVVHCDLGRVEWQGTAELAEAQAACYPGVRFIKVKRDGPDLLDAIRARGQWPDQKNRYCTSDFKRAEVDKVMTALVAETLGGPFKTAAAIGRRVRILNVMGFRATESKDRAERAIFDAGDELRPKNRCVKNADGTWKMAPNKDGKLVKVKEEYLSEGRGTNGKRIIDNWLPIHNRTDADIWEGIRRAGVIFHKAYVIGMRRLSCVLCVFAPKEALLLAGKHNPCLLNAYVEVGEEIKAKSREKTGKEHLFRKDLDILCIKTTLESGYEPDPKKIRTWKM